jgi:hypothetical protein
MKKVTGIAQAPALDYVGTLLAARVAELRRKVGARDVGASAIELAIITALIGAVALALALIIVHVVDTRGTQVQQLGG